MIEPVSKYLFLVYHKEYEAFLLRLRQLGVVHIQETKKPHELQELRGLVEQRKVLSAQIKALKRLRSKEAQELLPMPISSKEKGDRLLKEVEDWQQRLLQIDQQIAAQKRENDYWAIWGDYSLESINKLELSGYPVSFYSVISQQYNPKWEQDFNAVVINEFRSHTYFVTVGDFESHKIEAERVKNPTQELQELHHALLRLEEEKEEIQQALQQFADQRLGLLMGYESLLTDQYNFNHALLQVTPEADNKLMLLEGWVVRKDADAMEEALKEEPCYVQQLEITEEDSIPIKLNNNGFARLFEPITKMYSLPNYYELDSTPLFAPFFLLFFTLCFGDAGYGLLIFLGSTWFKYKKSKQGKLTSGAKDLLTLAQWLGGTTAVIGSALGTVFGMVMPWANDGSLLGGVRDDYFLNQNNMMLLSVVLGIIQILFGKLVAAVKIKRQKGLRYALSAFAWVAIIVSLIGALAIPMLFPQSPKIIAQVFYGLAIAAGLVAFFYNMPGKNLLVNFGGGLWAAYNTASGLLGDTLSYIRLFAIGLTSGVLGGVFNNLAVDMSSGLPIGVNFLVMAFILLFGHSLNFGLAIISSLVHPLRLTFVEFYKNSEFEGGGRAFTPFKMETHSQK